MAATLPVDANTVDAPKVSAGDPSSPSSDYTASARFWKMASDILAGTEAMRHPSLAGRIGGPAIQFENVPQQRFNILEGVQAQSPYLPKLPNEPWIEYDRRRRNAFMTNIYGDISTNLSSKPFSKTCELDQKSSEDLKKLAQNIDGLGNNMHVFARDVFKTAMDKGITWIMPEFTKVPAGATLADEREIGARPYWVHIPVERLRAVYSKFINGTEIIFHARIDEPSVELDGYEEKVVRRVRELTREPLIDVATGEIKGFGPAKWRLMEEEEDKDEKTGRTTTKWTEIDKGDITIGVIPLVPIILGKRDGTSWRVTPPLRDLAFMQVKLFQMESNLDSTTELTAFPMLTGNGINGLDNENKVISVPVGPRAVLFAPPNNSGTPGSWGFIEPAGSSLTFLEQRIEKHKIEMRDLGYQPLTSANLTVITTANISIKAHSAVQAWALMLKDALEQSWKITMLWLKKPTTEVIVQVHTDFGVDLDGASDMADLKSMEERKVISKKTYFEEAKRRGVLMDDADYEAEQEQIATESANDVLTPEKLIDPVTGMPIVVTPQPGIPNPPPKPPIKLRQGERIVN